MEEEMNVKNPMRRKFLQSAAYLGAAAALGPLLHGCGGGGGSSGNSVGTLTGLRAIDAHAHPDHFYRANQIPPDNSSTLSAIKSVAMAASSFAAVGDMIFKTTGSAGGDEYNSALTQLSYVINMANQGSVRIVRTTADIPIESSATVSPGAILSLEGGDALMGDPEKLVDFYNLGVRIVTLIHDRNNEFGDSVRGNPGMANGGLSVAGIQAVARMESLGMVIDVSHSTSQTMTGVCNHAHKPVIDSHTSLFPGPTQAVPSRLRTMAEMELIAATGGLVCLWPLASGTRLTIADWAAEIKTLKTNIGIDHIAFGTDGGGSLPAMVSGYQSVADLPKLADAMRSAGLSENDTKAFFGGNMLRILGQCIG